MGVIDLLRFLVANAVHIAPPSFADGFAEQVFDLRVEAAQVVAGPALQLFRQLAWDPQKE